MGVIIVAVIFVIGLRIIFGSWLDAILITVSGTWLLIVATFIYGMFIALLSKGV